MTIYRNGNFISSSKGIIRNRYTLKINEPLKFSNPEYCIVKNDKFIDKLEDVIDQGTNLVLLDYNNNIGSQLLKSKRAYLWDFDVFLRLDFNKFKNLVENVQIEELEHKLVLPYLELIVDITNNFDDFLKILKIYQKCIDINIYSYALDETKDHIHNGFVVNDHKSCKVNIELNLDITTDKELEKVLNYQLYSRYFYLILTGNNNNISSSKLNIIKENIEKRKLIDIEFLNLYSTLNIPNTIKFNEFNNPDWTITLDLEKGEMYNDLGVKKTLTKISKFY